MKEFLRTLSKRPQDTSKGFKSEDAQKFRGEAVPVLTRILEKSLLLKRPSEIEYNSSHTLEIDQDILGSLPTEEFYSTAKN